jgi:hypothetical protein
MFDEIGIEDFKRRTEINGASELAHPWERVSKVVSLRSLETIYAIQLMSTAYLEKLLSHVVLQGGNRSRVYEGCKIHIMQANPGVANIGQKFVERRKCQNILENIGGIVDQFATPSGALHIGAFIALGRTKESETVIAHYLPPIAEMNGDTAWKWLDGIHRGWLNRQMGATLPIIAIEGVKIPFPCAVHPWKDVKPVDEKPPKEERFFDLKPELFRDLKYVGIDG